MSEWQTVSGGGGTFVKLQTEGQIVEGVLKAQRSGEYGPLFDFQQQDGSVITVPGNYILNEQLPGIVGKVVRITYNGKKPTKSGKTVKDFLIQVSPDDAEDYLHPAKAAADDDDGMPF